jgi:hypothetical protein
MIGEQSSKEEGSMEAEPFWEELRSFELAQRPTKYLLTLGTCYYDEH